MNPAKSANGEGTACPLNDEARDETSPSQPEAVTEFLILPDGRLMVHNLTPTMAALLSELNPNDEVMTQRSQNLTQHAIRNTR